MQAEDTTRDRTDDWANYYKEVVSAYFKIPNTAVIKNAVHTDTAIMGMRFTVRFTLPRDRTPEQWLALIAAESGAKPDYKKGSYIYDCAKDCDLWKLQYIPEEDVYVAQAGWD